MGDIQLKFDPNQNHQTQAVQSVVELFDGFSRYESSYMSSEIVANIPEGFTLERNWLLDNLMKVQAANKITPQSIAVETDSGFMVSGVSADTWEYPTFTVEMETGTGKTYVYLRLIHELKKQYGFRKYIIVVPSVAIYEGVIKSFKITQEHFKSLYGNETVHLLEYEGQKQGVVKNYATVDSIDILVMTIDSFNKASNLLYKKTDKLMGERLPYQFIQETRPILILDESQNYRSDTARAALRTIKPLFAVNFSATPVDKPNLVYCLTPVDAFRLNLVKKIEVLGLIEAQSTTRREDYLKVESIGGKGKNITATLRLNVYEKGSLVEKVLDFKHGDNLYAKTKNESYKSYIIDEINIKENFIAFKNDIRVYQNDERYASFTKEALFRHQIEETIKVHIDKQKELRPRGIKVLTLFFIDRVANYVEDDGIIRKLFEQSFEKLKKRDEYFKAFKVKEVHNGYFAKKKVKNNSPEEYVDTAIEEEDKKKEDKEAEKAAYSLIMRDKERLLSFDEKVSFIFAHSALREGWDNPNVFQICALREITSEKERRQSIGRGLRLPVTQDGERNTDTSVNNLTVIANESYQTYVANLQQEYVLNGDVVPYTPSDASQKEKVHRIDSVYQAKDFSNFWKKLVRLTDYSIRIDTDSLITECVTALNNTLFPEPSIIITRGEYVITSYDISLVEVKGNYAFIRIDKNNTQGESGSNTPKFSVGSNLAVSLKDPLLSGFKITDISGSGEDAKVVFSEAGTLTLGNSISFSSEQGQSFSSRIESEKSGSFPKFNLIERASKDLSITRATILDIFKRLRTEKKQAFMKNPEGFSGIFISTIRERLADHIAAKIEYQVSPAAIDKTNEEFFPETRIIPKKELTVGKGGISIYDFIQYDSEVEKKFVERLNNDEKVILYFKFPPIFKINIPKIIGNYNPDWGILRWDENKKIKLELVRETKGSINPNLLQHPNEKRKIDCALKHFKTIGVSYRHVTADIPDWWKDEVIINPKFSDGN
jgi:type III restriction enzyme